MRFLLIAGALLLGACGPTTKGDSCAKFGLKHVPVSGATHVACTDVCGNGENPPTGGNHCPTTLACKTFLTEQPRCNWVHNLEHGHVVLLFNCPGGCKDVTDQLDALRQKGNRILVTEDPAIPGKVGAVVWGWSWVGDSVDEDAIACVTQHQDQEAPEAGLGCAQ